MGTLRLLRAGVLAGLIAGGSMSLPAQDDSPRGGMECARKKQTSPAAPRLPASALHLPSPPRHAYDVLEYRLNLDLHACFLAPYPKSFRAEEVITVQADSTISSILLDADGESLVIDSVGMAATGFEHTSNALTLLLDRTYQEGERAQVRISYRHADIADNAFYAGNGMVFTDCEPEGARKWFPCWDKPSDKATVDITAKVPATVKLGSNGRLADSVRVADTLYYRWISRDPVATYLVVISAKVNYNLDIVLWPTLSNPEETVPIRFYYNTGESGVNAIKGKIVPMTDEFSRLFGEHPFEKNGFATLNSEFAWGGMENQTLTSLCPNCWGEGLIAHEFAHQWFGDMVTCGTWADIWLNEGFATYAEALWAEHTSGYGAYKNAMASEANAYLNYNPGWPIYNPSWATTTPSNSILFNYAITYAKSACILHLFRYIVGDSLFFRAVKEYATDTTQFKYKAAVTADFVRAVSTSAGGDLAWFFDAWLKQPGHPVYANTYNVTPMAGGTWQLAFRTRQIQAGTFFPMVLELRVSFAAGGDTVLSVMNSMNDQTFAFTFDRQPGGLEFDPANEIIIKSATTSAGGTLAAVNLQAPADGAVADDLLPSLRWEAAVSATSYHFQVAADSLFASPVVDDSTAGEVSVQVGPLASLTRYWWRVRGRNGGGIGPWSAVWSFTSSTSSDAREGAVPTAMRLLQNYPNPFNPTTRIGVELPVAADIRLVVIDLLGREVTTLLDGRHEAGTHAVTFDAAGLSSGVYLYRLRAGGAVLTRTMTLIR